MKLFKSKKQDKKIIDEYKRSKKLLLKLTTLNINDELLEKSKLMQHLNDFYQILSSEDMRFN